MSKKIIDNGMIGELDSSVGNMKLRQESLESVEYLLHDMQQEIAESIYEGYKTVPIQHVHLVLRGCTELLGFALGELKQDTKKVEGIVRDLYENQKSARVTCK